jgi:hypothetical protein
MNLRQSSTDAFGQDTWRVTANTNHRGRAALRVYGALGREPAVEQPVGGRWPSGRVHRGPKWQTSMLMYPNKLRFAPRLGLAHHFSDSGIVFRATHGIFYTRVASRC